MAVKKKAAKKKTAAKKTAIKKPAAKRAAKKKVVKKAAAPAKKLVAVKTPYTKTQIVAEIADKTELSKKQVNAVFEELGDLMERHLKPRSAGSFTMPGLLKVVTQKVPARRAKKNVPNPFRPGETMDVAARPAFNRVKVRPLKKLKDMVG